MFRLDGRVAVVTGASSGLGAVFARALAEAGADVALGARRVDRLADTQQAVEKAGRRAIAVRTDVAVPEDCQALVDAAMAEFGRVDILVNNAGVERRRRPPGRRPTSSGRSSTSTSTAVTGWRRPVGGSCSRAARSSTS